jgi:4,5-dihydroxyphthalate decarboxylase
MDSTTRHWRFLRGSGVRRGGGVLRLLHHGAGSGLSWHRNPCFSAPAISRRLHVHHTSKGISKPKDLIGKRIGLKQFQATAIVWMRGILENEYGVPADSIEWVCELDETIEFTPPPGRRCPSPSWSRIVTSLPRAGQVLYHSPLSRERGVDRDQAIEGQAPPDLRYFKQTQ